MFTESVDTTSLYLYSLLRTIIYNLWFSQEIYIDTEIGKNDKKVKNKKKEANRKVDKVKDKIYITKQICLKCKVEALRTIKEHCM